MFILDTFLGFVLDKVLAAAEAEMSDDSALRQQLLEAEMRLELGELTREDFAGIERDLLSRIRAIKRGQRSDALTMSAGKVEVSGIDLPEELND